MKKKSVGKSQPSKQSSRPVKTKSARSWIQTRLQKLKEKRQNFLARRPHRSFRRTRKRDYKRSLKLPGYWALTRQVGGIIFRNSKTLLGLAAVYVVLAIIVSSMISQDIYTQVKESINEVELGQLVGSITPLLMISWSVIVGQISGSLATSSDSTQRTWSIILMLLIWLSTIVIIRGIMANKRLKIRDGLYSSGGPVLALLMLVAILLIQLIPATIAVLAYGAASETGLFNQTFVLMLFAGGAILLVTLSLYWAVSTVLAMIIVTIPGMYPMRAIKLAGDIVVGRRVRVILRLAWAVVLLLVGWVTVLMVFIPIDNILKQTIPSLDWLPLVPFVSLIMMALSIVFLASYTYVFYRRMIEDDSPPA